MDALGVTIIRVAGRTCLDHPDLIPLPRGYLVNLLMAVCALNVIKEMGACIMCCPFFFMTSMAGDWLGMNSCPFCSGMDVDIRDVIVATVARIGTMNRLGKLPFAYFFVTTQTFRVVNTFIAVFSTPDDKFLSLFRRSRGFGHHGDFPPSFSGPDVAAHELPDAKKSEKEKIRKKRAVLINFGFIMLPKFRESPRPPKMQEEV